MAITPLTAPWKMFTFDGVTSGSLGVAILGDGAFNAPERDVEMVAIPGRNGDYILDKGRYMNIEVTYPCTLVADSVADFPQAMADLRSLLCSKTTYCRLEDDYNPNEYRMAMYKSGLEVDPMVLKAGTFDITFECKPQRFLKSGETAVSVTSGDEITNPTIFTARPLLEVNGYGDINFGDDVISIESRLIGRTQLSRSKNENKVSLDVSMMNNGDSFTVDGIVGSVIIQLADGYSFASSHPRGISSPSNCTASIESVTTSSFMVTIKVSSHTFTVGTGGTWYGTATLNLRVVNNGTETSLSKNIGISVIYDKNKNRVEASRVVQSATEYTRTNGAILIPDIWGTSTKSALGSPMYIDLDIGECYNTDYGTAVSVNDAVSLPAVLPTLPSGATEITYDNTITQLDIVPRWWQV